ncbi:transglutaminase-like domain-containing protein [Anaerovorax sp. IOR16]|uniref:transglutaminase-like domain-containing protein n=1 Tax=Anaerovorax sp. IOR16 TaxID=2773458 RepID=UPI0019D1D509|nr:transglutaminase-like domain-containing protein [Anaerovorax sp. IOR16]
MKDFIVRYDNDIIAYIIVFFVLLYVTLWILGILSIPIYKYLILPITDKISHAYHSMSSNTKRILSIVWQLPKSIFIIILFSLLLSFYTNYVNSPSAESYINHSLAYRIVNNHILNPILSTDTVKSMPVFINNSIKKATEDFTPANKDDSEYSNYWKITAIKYFNGMTLDEAVKSNSDIDNMAKNIVSTGKDEKEKAYLLYEWISRNIQYDKDKVEMIEKNSSHVNSGSIVTYSEGKGVCFDYSCLYVSMCRAVGLKVRFVTGMGYNGTEWGDHAWNQVYNPDEDRWINVDTTFGNSGVNYFDNSNFSINHKYEVVQGEW